jgi:hypothetical protein
VSGKSQDSFHAAHNILSLRFLIGWNQAIFDIFVPSAWIKLLYILIEEDKCNDIWSAWPPVSSPGQYWANLVEKMLDEAIANNDCVFPRFPNRGIPAYVPLSSSLVASSSDNPSVLDALALAGVSIVQPPQHMFDLLGMKFQKRCQRLNPPNVHRQLSNHIRGLELLDASDKNVILNYLILSSSPHSLDHTFGLPLIPMFGDNRTYAVLSRRESLSKTFVLASDEENDLFGDCDHEMIALSKMPTEVQQLLCNPQAAQRANVAVLDENRVNVHLHQMFGRYNPALDDIDDPEAGSRIDWLIRFWAWMDSWSGGRRLLPLIERFHLLPTGTRTLKKVQTGILLQTDMDPKDVAALKQLGIQFLHPDVAVSSPGILLTENIGLRSDDIPAVIQHIPEDIPSIDSHTSLRVQKYFVRCLQNRKVNKSLSTDLIGVFRKLPIFPILVPNPGSGQTDAIVAPAIGQLLFVDARGCPLPLQREITYVDVSNPTRALALLVDPKAIKHAYSEMKILERAIPILENQPHPLLDSLISRIIPRIPDLSESSLENLRKSRFVSAQGSSDRFAPNKIIDPNSELAPLYFTETGRFPRGPFRTVPFLPVMCFPGFFQQSLTPELILERIEYISTTSETPDSRKKARLLLQLLDKSWGDLPSFTLPSDAAWLPVIGSDTLHPGNQCRDINDNRYLFDLVLRVVNIRLTSSGLRASLGWAQDIPFPVLRRQLQSTLKGDGVTNYGERLMILIKYMANSYAKGSITNTDIENLAKEDIGDNYWIPVAPHEFILTRHAILSAEFKDVGPFRKVPRSLLGATHVVAFLKCIGCADQ